jgi:hypothetical protein
LLRALKAGILVSVWERGGDVRLLGLLGELFYEWGEWDFSLFLLERFGFRFSGGFFFFFEMRKRRGCSLDLHAPWNFRRSLFGVT